MRWLESPKITDFISKMTKQINYACLFYFPLTFWLTGTKKIILLDREDTINITKIEFQENFWQLPTKK